MTAANEPGPDGPPHGAGRPPNDRLERAEPSWQRAGGFVLLRDMAGQRHALRLGAIQAVSEDTETGRTLLSCAGGRVLVLEADFETVLQLLDPQAAAPSSRSTPASRPSR